MTKKKMTTRKKPLTQKKKKKSPVAVKASTRTTSKVKSAKTPTPVKKVKKQRKPKNDINAEIDRILAGMCGPKTTKRKTQSSKPKRMRKLSMKELNRKIGKMVREALEQ